jgi:DNA-binding protein HU-beta
MHKTDLIGAIAQKTKLSKKDSIAFLDAFLETVTKSLKKGENVTLIGFGTFKVNKTAPRKGRNPRTGKEIQIKASKRPKFTAGKALKDAVK